MTSTTPDDATLRFIAANPHAAMVTVATDGRPKAVKMELALVDGRLESVSHADKVRTKRLRRDPRCTLYVADAEHRWLTLEADVDILDGPGAPDLLLRYFRIHDGRPTEALDYHSDRSHHTALDDAAFKRIMTEEQAVLYRFTVTKTYGNI